MSGTELIMGMGEIINYLKDLEEKNKKLKEENECVKRQIESVCKANDKLKEEIKELKEEFIEDSESEEEEEKTKYDGDDWAYGYGFTTTNGEYRINMAGGGDHWEDYVINKDGCFIHNGCGESQVRTFISSPEGSYVKAVFLADPEYELEEGETDMYEMVQECFIEEIMEYCEEEEKCEINVVGLGFCQYENEEERDKQVVYCKNGCWKIRGDKTAKDEEGNYCETDEEQITINNYTPNMLDYSYPLSLDYHPSF